MQVASDTCTPTACFLHVLCTLFGSDPWEVSSGWLVGGDRVRWAVGGDWWEVTVGRWAVEDDCWEVTNGRREVTGGRWEVGDGR